MLPSMDEQTVGQLVAAHPEWALVFEEFQIDYCCQGNVSLSEACKKKGISADQVRDKLTQVQNLDGPESSMDQASIAEIIDHITNTYHKPLVQVLSQLQMLIVRVESKHAARHPELVKLKNSFMRFRSALEAHMDKEDRILFPMCLELDSAQAMPVFHCGSVTNPIRMMEFEHEDAGQTLNEFRSLTNDYTPPEDACTSYKLMIRALEKLELDMHKHVHLENSVLFPKVKNKEAGLVRKS